MAISKNCASKKFKLIQLGRLSWIKIKIDMQNKNWKKGRKYITFYMSNVNIW